MGQASTFSDLIDMMLVELPGCPAALLTQHLQQAARKFCIDTEAYLEELAAIDLVAEDVTYTLTPAHTGCEIRRIKEVWIRTEEDVDDDLDGTLQAFDKYEFEPQTNVLTLDDSIEPQEAVTDGLVVKVVLVPFLKSDIAATAVSDDFLNVWAEPIMARALFTLKRMSRKSWSDPQGAMVNLQEYNDGVTRAKQEVEGFEYRSEQDTFGA